MRGAPHPRRPRGTASGSSSSTPPAPRGGGPTRGKSAAPPGNGGPPPGWESLLGESGAKRLTEVEAELAAGATTAQAGSRLRAEGVAPDEVAALLTQADLRTKARAKFGEAATRMLFTPAGLEQATRAPVAALHARRFAEAGCTTVADLGCGLGSESLALLASGVRPHPVELDPFTARLAEHNLGVPVAVADAETAALEDVDGVFLDPARRTTGHRDTRRLTSPDDYSPSLDFAFGLAERFPTGVKLGPGFDRELIPGRAEAQWISVDGQLVETGLWFGSVARPNIARAALLLQGGQAHELTANADSPDPEVRPLGRYLFEPDGAVIRARLIGLLAERIGAGLLSEGIAYLTGDAPVETAFARAFRVVEELPVREKELRRALAEREIGTLEIKKRGADADPAALRARLRLKGSRSATLFLTRAAGRHIALLAERC